MLGAGVSSVSESTTSAQYGVSSRCSTGTVFNVPEDESNAISYTLLVYSDPECILRSVHRSILSERVALLIVTTCMKQLNLRGKQV